MARGRGPLRRPRAVADQHRALSARRMRAASSLRPPLPPLRRRRASSSTPCSRRRDPSTGICVDDVARGARGHGARTAPDPDRASATRSVYLDFVVAAQTTDGGFHNRRAADGQLGRRVRLRRLLGARRLGPGVRELAARTLDSDRGAHRGHGRQSGRSPSPRSMSFAASALPRWSGSPRTPRAHRTCSRTPQQRSATCSRRRLAVAGATAGVRERSPAGGPAGHRRPRSATTASYGTVCDLLTWLVGVQTRNDQLSLVPAGGWQPGEPGRRFDQQPIEAAAIAEPAPSGVRRDRGRHLASSARSLPWPGSSA